MEEKETYSTQENDMKQADYPSEVFVNKSGIRQAELREFARRVIDHFEHDKVQMAHFLKGSVVAEKAKKILEEEGLQQEMVDAIVTGALLARTNIVGEAYKGSHTIEFPLFLKRHGLDEGVEPNFLAAIVRMVRGSLGPKSPITEFAPKPGQPEYLVSLIYRLEEL